MENKIFRMRAIPYRTSQNTLIFLHKLYDLTKEGYNSVVMHQLVRECKLANKTCQAIIQSGIIIGSRGRYKWNSTIPDLKMANKIVIINRNYNMKKSLENNKLTQTQSKTLNFLNEVYSLTNEKETYVSLHSLCKKHEINYINTTSIVKAKLVSRRSAGSHVNSLKFYKWNSIKPNLKMVDKLLDFNIKERKMIMQSKIDKAVIIKDVKKQEVSKPIAKDKKVVVVDNIKKQVATKQQRQISIFWGMFKFNY